MAPPAPAELPKITREAIAAAEKLWGIPFTDAERDQMVGGLSELREEYVKIREVPLANSVPPALRFDPRPAGFALPSAPAPARFRWSGARPRLPPFRGFR